jgi:hypothetical protein
MRIVVLIARILLGLEFTVFGLNGLFHFLHMPMPTGVAGEFMGAMVASHYIVFVAGCQVIGGILLLINRMVPLGLTILGALIVNILLFHILMNPQGLPMAVFTTLLWFLVFHSVRGAFTGILTPPGKA